MRRILVMTVISLLLLFAVSNVNSASTPSWHFTYEAENANFTTSQDIMRVRVVNGIAYLTTDISNLTEKLETGMRITVNITVEVSPLVVNSGIKIIIGEDVMIDKKLYSGNYTLQFYSLHTYNSTDKFIIVLYSYGGEMDIAMETHPYIEKPRGGVNEGLFLTGVGISVVFLVLGILAVVMYLLKPSEKMKKKTVEKPVVKKGVDVKEKKLMEREVDEEVVAAITGALSLYLGGRKFRIISVKPSPWKYYGRLKNMRRLK
jgi:Na+-transporting methylmalonyl-CoA/oxaloacetate decarboxylase gamma subunit